MLWVVVSTLNLTTCSGAKQLVSFSPTSSDTSALPLRSFPPFSVATLFSQFVKQDTLQRHSYFLLSLQDMLNYQMVYVDQTAEVLRVMLLKQ